jgi:1-acyl-sn-glycerol-3-phosphate acyltransferase
MVASAAEAPSRDEGAPRALVGVRRSRLAVAIYSALYWPYLLATCAVLFWPALALFVGTFWWDRSLRILHRYTTWWGGHYLSWAPLVQTLVRGKEKLGRGPYVFVSNHQSMVDVLAVFATGLDFKWVSKVENFYAPFIGWSMVLNRYVPLKRGRLPSIVRMVRRSLAWVRKGESLWIFPEGTRSPDGALQAFHRGAFGIASRCGVPVVPVVVVGTAEILPKGAVTITPHPVTIHILDPIHPSTFGHLTAAKRTKALRDLVHAKMADELASMRRD